MTASCVCKESWVSSSFHHVSLPMNAMLFAVNSEILYCIYVSVISGVYFVIDSISGFICLAPYSSVCILLCMIRWLMFSVQMSINMWPIVPLIYQWLTCLHCCLLICLTPPSMITPGAPVSTSFCRPWSRKPARATTECPASKASVMCCFFGNCKSW